MDIRKSNSAPPPTLPTLHTNPPPKCVTWRLLYLRPCHPRCPPLPPGAPGPARSRWFSQSHCGPGPQCSGLSAGSVVPSMPAVPGSQGGLAGHPGGPTAPAGRYLRHQSSHPSRCPGSIPRQCPTPALSPEPCPCLSSYPSLVRGVLNFTGKSPALGSSPAPDSL